MPHTKELTLLEPATQAFVDALAAKGAPPLYTLTVENARKVLEDAQSTPASLAGATVELVQVPRGVAVNIVRPSHANGRTLPGIAYFHGGGWVLGSFHTHERLVRAIAAGTDAAVLFVNYSPSPEARFPVPLDQAYNAFRYFAESGVRHGIDGRRLALAGDSVGGNIAAVVAIMANTENGPFARAQLLFYPVTSAGFHTASYSEFAGGPWLTRKAMEWFWDAYAPDKEVRESVVASPLLAGNDALAGLPEAMVITAEADVLRDEGEQYAHHLSAAGVRTTAIRYSGTIHDFVMLNALANTPAALHATQTACDFLRAHLDLKQ